MIACSCSRRSSRSIRGGGEELAQAAGNNTFTFFCWLEICGGRGVLPTSIIIAVAIKVYYIDWSNASYLILTQGGGAREVHHLMNWFVLVCAFVPP